MSIVPPTDLDAIQFCESHIPVWSLSPSSVGLTAAAVQNLDNQTKAARAAYIAAQNARQASKAATTNYHNNTTIMRGTVSDLLKTIKAFAANDTNPAAIYAKAQIPEPLPPTPAGAPGPAKEFSVGLNGDGSLKLMFKATDGAPSSGATYNVTRQLNGTGSFVPVGSAISRKAGNFEFVDFTLPRGSSRVAYIVTGVRNGQSTEPSDSVSVQFGVGGGTGDNFTVSNNAIKLAA